jgi:adenosylmethionine-8-amino-7-oxononanoate aminotransferase
VAEVSSGTGSTSALAAPATLLECDAALLWHPYASPQPAIPPYFVRDADGVRILLDDGHGQVIDAIDAMSSWWCMIHGYRNPVLDRAAHDQIDRFSHVMFGGLTHEPAIRLAQQLVAITPEPLEHVFFADSGSVSVEVALKMALQYQLSCDRPSRTRMLTIAGGYHGDTFGAMSVCDPGGGMHAMFTDALTPQHFAPQPPAGYHRAATDPEIVAWAGAVRQLARVHADDIAAIVVEPILQGAGGMFIYSPACVRILRDIADEYGFLLILDEIATGFGRTGTLFASEHADVSADIVCVGKALTGGYLTLAATLCTRAVATAIAGGPGGTLMHGPTFMANPLACAVASASIDLLLEKDWAALVSRISADLSTGLAPATAVPGVRDVRVVGAVGVIQLDGPVDVRKATEAALRQGVWIRPFRDLIYTMPPYVTTPQDIETITAAMTAAAAAGAA